MSKTVEITITCPTEQEARLIGSSIVKARQAACAQVWPIQSTYWWNDELVEDQEVVLLLKTTADRFVVICDMVKPLHSYELPAIVMNETMDTGPGYAAWIEDVTAPV